MPRKRLIWQLFPSFLFITLLSLIAITWYFARLVHDFQHSQTLLNLEIRARLIEGQITDLIRTQNRVALESICQRLGQDTSTRITIIAPSGEVLGDSEENPEVMENHADRPEIRIAFDGNIGNSTRFSHTLQQEMKYVAIPIRNNEQIIGVIRTSFPVTAINQTLRHFFLQVSLAGFVIAVLSAVVSLMISRSISRPLERLKEGAQLFACEKLDHRLDIPNTQEIGALAESMNQMAVQLDERIRTIQRQRKEHEAILSSMVEGVLAVDQEENIISINHAASLMFNVHTRRGSREKYSRSGEIYGFASNCPRCSFQ